jgi:hypothetical protein
MKLSDAENRALSLLKKRIKKICKPSDLIEFAVGFTKLTEPHRVIVGQIRNLDQKEILDASWDYDHISFVRWAETKQKALETISTAINEKVLRLPNNETVALPGSLETHSNEEHYYHPSRQKWGTVSSLWPRYDFNYGVDQSNLSIPRGHLVSKSLPLFLEWWEAATDLLNLNCKPESLQGIHILTFTIYDYRARIEEVVISGKRIKVIVKTRNIQPLQIQAKIFCRDEKHMTSSKNLPIKGGFATFKPSFEPTIVGVVILSKSKGEIIDSREINLRWKGSNEGVRFETSESQLSEILSRGEGVNVEFKEDLTTSNNYLKTVVAFANSEGGVIIFGVNNEGIPVRSIQTDPDRIVNAISENVEPYLEPTFESVSLSEKDLLLVRIPPGSNKPYLLRNRGIFVRKGATSRQITRFELNEILKGSKNQITFGI